MLELYLSRNVRKQKQFATYVSFLDARCPLPDCVFSVYEQDRDENLYSSKERSIRGFISNDDCAFFHDPDFYVMPWRDGAVFLYKREKLAVSYVCDNYRHIDFIGRTDLVDESVVYNLLLSSYQFVCAQSGSLLMHAGALDYHGDAIVFCGVSGAGKSTQVTSWINQFKAKPINYDHPCVVWNGSVPVAYGSPWGGKENYCKPIGAPIKAIVFVNKSDQDNVKELKKGEAFSLLALHNALPHIRPEMDEKFLDVVEPLVNNVPVYRQKCTKTPKAAETLYRVLYGS